MTFDDRPLRRLLYREPERVANREIEPAVHDPEAVGGADHRIRRMSEVVRGAELDVVRAFERALPSPNHLRIVIDQPDPHGVYRTRTGLRRLALACGGRKLGKRPLARTLSFAERTGLEP